MWQVFLYDRLTKQRTKIGNPIPHTEARYWARRISKMLTLSHYVYSVKEGYYTDV